MSINSPGRLFDRIVAQDGKLGFAHACCERECESATAIQNNIDSADV